MPSVFMLLVHCICPLLLLPLLLCLLLASSMSGAGGLSFGLLPAGV